MNSAMNKRFGCQLFFVIQIVKEDEDNTRLNLKPFGDYYCGRKRTRLAETKASVIDGFLLSAGMCCRQDSQQAR